LRVGGERKSLSKSELMWTKKKKGDITLNHEAKTKPFTCRSAFSMMVFFVWIFVCLGLGGIGLRHSGLFAWREGLIGALWK